MTGEGALPARPLEQPAVVFLGAGTGTRLLPYTADRPKWLLPVRGSPILHTLVATAHSAGLTNLVLVRRAGGAGPGVPCIGIAENPRETNMLGSLFCAEAWFGSDFILSYADILYEPRVLRALLESSADVSVVVDADFHDYYRFRAQGKPHTIAESLTLRGAEIAEIGSPLSSEADLPGCQYVGLVRFRSDGVRALAEAYHALARDYRDRRWRHAARFDLAFMTDMLQELIDRGVDVRAVQVERGWVEFDTKEDYEGVLAADRSGGLSEFIDLNALPQRPTVVSAGGVALRHGRSGREVMVVAQGRASDWRLPKGMQERGERLRRTAEREFAEETGLQVEARRYVGRSGWTYTFEGRDWDEVAYFYWVVPTQAKAGPVADSQIVEARWMSADAALTALKDRGEREVLKTALSMEPVESGQ